MSKPPIIHPAPSLAALTTLRLGGRAQALLDLTDVDDSAQLEAAAREVERMGVPVCALGRGSNVLAADGDLPVALLRDKSAPWVEGLAEDDAAATIRVAGSMALPALVRWTLERGYAGLEGMLGVPGSVGGAVAMNAGSFGCDMGGTLSRVRVFTPGDGLQWRSQEDFRTGYRTFRLMRPSAWFLVVAAELSLTRAPREAVRAKARESIIRKRLGQPVQAWSAGCVYRNPEGEKPAGMLLDEAGFRGARLGGVGFSAKHANFLVHHGGGSAEEAFALLEEAESVVLERFGVALEKEVKVWPCN